MKSLLGTSNAKWKKREARLAQDNWCWRHLILPLKWHKSSLLRRRHYSEQCTDQRRWAKWLTITPQVNMTNCRWWNLTKVSRQKPLKTGETTRTSHGTQPHFLSVITTAIGHCKSTTSGKRRPLLVSLKQSNVRLPITGGKLTGWSCFISLAEA